MNLEAVRRHEVREPFSPFNEHDGVAIENLVQTETGDLLGSIQAVQVDVKCAAVFVNQREGGAGHVILIGGAQAADDSFGEGGFSGTQVADEEHDRARGKLGGDAAAERDGFFFRTGFKYTHEWPSEDSAANRWRARRTR